MDEKQLKDKIESLEIQLRHVTNDYNLTKREFEESTRNYLEILSELREKNQTLQDFQKNLEQIVEKRTEELQESQRILQVKSEEQQIMLDSSPAMIFYTDLANKFVRLNKLFADVVGRPIRQIIGKSDDEIFPHEAERFRKDNMEVLASGKAKHGILEYIDTPNGRRWILMDKIPYKDLDGRVIGILGFAIDITDRKILEEQLVHSEKLAAVGRLVAGVAHELNNPLSIILGYAQLLKAEPDMNRKYSEKLQKILDAAIRSSAIVDNLLKFSRKSRLDRTNIQINKILDEALTLTQHSLMVENIVVSKDFSSLPETTGDALQLQSVFLNLINNAHDAIKSRKSKGRITVKSYHQDNTIFIEFFDNGPGIPAQNQNKIFDPFFTSKEVGKGTGLGLSLCYGIIKEHDGEISLDTTYKEGAKFIVSLPVHSVRTRSSVPLDKTDVQEKARVLIIEDESEMAEMQQMIFSSRSDNFIIDIAVNGSDGLDLLDQNDYDLIICDIKMPGRYDGLAVYQNLKERNPLQADQIIFITGDVSPDTIRFLESHNLPFLRKPFAISDFLSAVNNRLKGRNIKL